MKTEKQYQDNLFILNQKQRKAFLRFKSAYNDLIKSGCGVYNNYGTIGFFDNKKIREYDDNNLDNSIRNEGQNTQNEIESVCSWADDTHYFQPTHNSKSY